MDFNLHMAGFELGYQFIFWNRLAVEMVLIGLGVGFYNIRAQAEGSLTTSSIGYRYLVHIGFLF